MADYINRGPRWEDVVAAWPEPLRARHRRMADELHAAGWAERTARYLAYGKIVEVGEQADDAMEEER